MHISQATQFADQAERRSQGYWLLAKLFLEVPTAERLQALRDPEATAVDFTRCLVNVNKESGEALPFEAHVRERRLPGEATEAMQLLSAECGYADVAPEAASPDHLGAELRLMALLCHDECQAWQTGALDAAVASLRRQNRLLGKHLNNGRPTFARIWRSVRAMPMCRPWPGLQRRH